MEKITIGTRGSKLALWQANHIKDLIENKHNIKVELNVIKTQGDIILDVPLAKIGGKGLFVKEIENALLDRTADLAVHSMKDVPAELPEGLELYVTPKRETPFDALLAVKYSSLADIPVNGVIGTSSLRRKLQIQKIRPDLKIEDLRGNVDTRIRKMTEGIFDAIILAKAGLSRLGLTEHIKETFTSSQMLPAVCQGTLGIEVRSDDKRIKSLLDFLNDDETSIRTTCERVFLQTLEGGCQAPIGGFAELNGNQLTMTGFLSDLSGNRVIMKSQTGDKSDAYAIGKSVAEAILMDGGREILDEIYKG